MYSSHQGPIDLIRAADIDVRALRQRGIGFVTQFLDVRPRMSAEDAVIKALPATTPRAQSLEAARDTLDALGLKRALWAADPRSFSGGEKQKVNLARTLLRPVRLLLLDEPTASLDRHARGALIDRLAALKGKGVAMIGVFHISADIASLADDTLTLPSRSGEMPEEGDADQVVNLDASMVGEYAPGAGSRSSLERRGVQWFGVDGAPQDLRLLDGLGIGRQLERVLHDDFLALRARDER